MKKSFSTLSGGERTSYGRLKRIATYGVFGLALLYLLGALAGYYWMHSVRHNDQIGFADVALLRWREVRRGVAVQQFAKAKTEWEAKNYQAAYLAFASAVRNDPDNIPGRVSAGKFLIAAGATTMALTLLEDGLARAPANRELIELTFDLLLSTGRDRHALDLLRARSPLQSADANGQLLQTYQVQATLNAEDAKAAGKLLEGYPELANNPAAQPVIARVLWETQERLKAIEMLDHQLKTQPDAAFSTYAQLVQWQLAMEMSGEALATAEKAVVKFPGDSAPQLLRIDVLATKSFRGKEWQQAVESYLREFSDRIEAIGSLADLCGRNGWVELARALYDYGAVHQPNVMVFALSYGDALMRTSHFREAQQVLADVESQATDAVPLFASALRQRQVMAAAALGDHELARDSARRMAVALRSDPDRLEIARRNFVKLGIAEAVSELSSPSLTAKISPRK